MTAHDPWEAAQTYTWEQDMRRGDWPTLRTALEREADAFAAEFLTPRVVIEKELPECLEFATLFRLSDRWGVEVRSLVYRSQELGIISESTARRAYIRL